MQRLVITTKHIESSNDNGEYYLMELDSDKGAVNLLAFKQSQLLDNPAPPTPLMRELLALGESMVKERGHV